jgi:esterase/lipase superfamily enzyme
LKREYRRAYSAVLDRDMELLVFGYAGPRALAFPPAMGRFFDWEDHGLIAALADQLERGAIQVYCLDTVDAESWANLDLRPTERARRHAQYDAYVRDEVLPLSSYENANSFVIAAGVDFGAYHAVTFGLRHPDLVNSIVGLSGPYDVSRFTDGYSDDEIYFNNPMEFIPLEHEPQRLRLLQQQEVLLGIGRGDEYARNNEQFSALLSDKGIRHVLRLWDGNGHSWAAWAAAIRPFVSGDVSSP